MADIMLLRVSEELNRSCAWKPRKCARHGTSLRAPFCRSGLTNHAEDAQDVPEGSGDKPHTIK